MRADITNDKIPIKIPACAKFLMLVKPEQPAPITQTLTLLFIFSRILLQKAEYKDIHFCNLMPRLFTLKN